MSDTIILQDGNLRVSMSDAHNFTPPPDYCGAEIVLSKAPNSNRWYILCQTCEGHHISSHSINPTDIQRALNRFSDFEDFRRWLIDATPEGVEYFVSTLPYDSRGNKILHVEAVPDDSDDAPPDPFGSDLVAWAFGNVYVLNVEEYLPEFGVWRPADLTRPMLVYSNVQAVSEAPHLLESAKLLA